MIYTSSCFPPSLVGMHATMQDAIDSWASGYSKTYRPPDLEESLEQAKAIAAAELGRELTVPEIEAIRSHHPPIDGHLKPVCWTQWHLMPLSLLSKLIGLITILLGLQRTTPISMQR